MINKHRETPVLTWCVSLSGLREGQRVTLQLGVLRAGGVFSAVLEAAAEASREQGENSTVDTSLGRCLSLRSPSSLGFQTQL